MKLPYFFVTIKKIIKSHTSLLTLAGTLFVSGCYYEKVIEPSSQTPYRPRSGDNRYYGNPPASGSYQNKGSYQNNGYGTSYQHPPASRYYDNPYSIAPETYYYDEDQYYKPPNAYGTEDVPNAESRY